MHSLVFQDARIGIGMLDALGSGLILATLRKTISEGECEEIAIVSGAGSELFVHIAIEDKGATA